jgi:hypothetical protein
MEVPVIPVPEEPVLKMEIAELDEAEANQCGTDDSDGSWGWDITDADITVKMLSKRRDIREALIQGLHEAFPERFGEDEDIPDETIVELMNVDAEVKSTLLEILLELTDCADAEGETAYYPSIQEYECAEDILKIEQVTGFRESREAIPFKYEHLRSETITIIYNNPQILPIISRMKKEQITDDFVLAALGVQKK